MKLLSPSSIRFFVVEDTVLHTSQSLVAQKASSSNAEGRDEGLVTSKNVQEFWQMALAEVMAVLRNNCVRMVYTVLNQCGLCSRHAVRVIV